MIETHPNGYVITWPIGTRDEWAVIVDDEIEETRRIIDLDKRDAIIEYVLAHSTEERLCPLWHAFATVLGECCHCADCLPHKVVQ